MLLEVQREWISLRPPIEFVKLPYPGSMERDWREVGTSEPEVLRDADDMCSEVCTLSPDGYYLAFRDFNKGSLVEASDFAQVLIVGAMHHTPREISDAIGGHWEIVETAFLEPTGRTQADNAYILGHGFISILLKREGVTDFPPWWGVPFHVKQP